MNAKDFLRDVITLFQGVILNTTIEVSRTGMGMYLYVTVTLGVVYIWAHGGRYVIIHSEGVIFSGACP